jgi:selenium metabolism protein YedF
MTGQRKTLLQINRFGMGEGDENLGMVLIQNYFKLLLQEDQLPAFIVFYNGGVRLVADDSPVLEILKAIEERGVRLLSCKTCLNHYGLIDKMKVGMAGSMLDIMALQNTATKVITL